MDEGYILSNKFRRAIFDGFASGESNIDRIAKKYRIIHNVAVKIAEEFINGGLLEKKGKRYFLTDEGKKIAGNIRG
jgi:predicted transcriptional regulator